ncbi:MAG: multidrug transporter MATE [Lactobacillus sp.]|nr:multidrug transporter MATE [Lactobacillus sp.]
MFKKNKLDQLAVPLMLSQVLGLVIGLCDQAVMGHLSVTCFASVAIVSGFINSVTGVLGMTATSFNILGSRARTQQEVMDEMWAQIGLSLGIGVLSILGMLQFGPFIFQQIYRLNGEVLAESLNYAMIFSASTGLNLLLFTCSSYLKIVHRTTYILIGNTVAAIGNVLLDVFLVYGCSLGMVGNAIGSVMALILNLIIYVRIFKKKELLRFRSIQLEKVWTILWASLLLMFQEFLESTVFVLVIGAFISRIGLQEMAVYQLINQLQMIAWMPMYAYAQAALTLVHQWPSGYRLALMRSAGMYGIISIVLVFAWPLLIQFLTNQVALMLSVKTYFIGALSLGVVNNCVTVYQYTLQSLGAQRWVLGMSLVCYAIGGWLISLGLEWWSSLWVVYLGWAGIYVVLAVMMGIKLRVLIRGD